MRTIGDTIKILREERRLSQQALADALHIQRSTVSMWEAGNRIPNDELKEQICDFFNVDLNYLYGKTDCRNSAREHQLTSDSDFDNIEYLKNKPELLEIYKELSSNDQLTLLFDKTRDLTPQDVESVLLFVQTIRKQRGMEE